MELQTMKKKTYNAPQCTAVQMNVEKFICLSIPIGPGPGPGGGGQAKANYFFDEEDESASDFSEADSEESKGN